MNPQTNQPPNTNLLIKRMNDFYRRHDHYRVLATPPDALWRQIAARYPSSNASAFEAITANEDILCETRPTYVVRAQYVAQYPGLAAGSGYSQQVAGTLEPCFIKVVFD